MGNLINIYAKAAAQRAVRLSWIAVNIGYARSELDDLVDEKAPETPPRLLNQLEAMLGQIITTEAAIAKLVRTFERKGGDKILDEIQETSVRISQEIHSLAFDYNAHSWQRAAGAIYAMWDGDTWDEEDDVGRLLVMIGGEIIPAMEFLETSFANSTHELIEAHDEERKSHEA
jgi:hypothetical protein